MKKISIIILSISFLSAHSFGQVSFGVKTGLNFNNAKNVGSEENKIKLGLNSGAFAEIGINSKFLIRPEVLYSIKGFKFPATPFNSKGSLSLDYVSIPILGGYRLNESFAILLGPEFNFLTGANSKFDGTDHDVSKNFKKFDMAIDLGAAYYISYGLGVELRYSYGFEDLADVIYTDALGNEIRRGRTGGNRVLQLGFFYKFSKK